MNDHTPGPWEVGPMHNTVRPADIATRRDNPNNGCAICTLYGDDDRPANARLIAAAPDLLLALQLILEKPDYDLLPAERADGEAAIRKATGG